MIQHDDVSFRVDRDTQRFAEIHIGSELEEIRHRIKGNQRNVVNDRHILIWSRLPDRRGGGSVSPLTASALREDGKCDSQNRHNEQNSRSNQPSLHNESPLHVGLASYHARNTFNFSSQASNLPAADSK